LLIESQRLEVGEIFNQQSKINNQQFLESGKI